MVGHERSRGHTRIALDIQGFYKTADSGGVPNMVRKELLTFISLIQFAVLSSCAVQFHYHTCPETVLTAEDRTRIRGFQDRTGDIILGGLFAVHTFVPGSDGGQCTDVVRDQGIESVEAMLYAIDTINSDPDLLPNVTLGYDIRDTCRSEKIGLDESANMVLANDSESCLSNTPAVMAVIGPLQSDVSIPVASFFSYFADAPNKLCFVFK